MHLNILIIVKQRPMESFHANKQVENPSRIFITAIKHLMATVRLKESPANLIPTAQIVLIAKRNYTDIVNGFADKRFMRHLPVCWNWMQRFDLCVDVYLSDK